jgi:hypothetical protein
VADHVADGERDPVVVEQEDVVPVAARLDLGRGQVAGRQRQPVVFGQRAGEQALLQDGGDAALAVGVDGPLQGLRGQPDERGGEAAFVGGELALRSGRRG